jgi:futalosine hydrolase
VKILIVTATEQEVGILIKNFDFKKKSNDYFAEINNHSIQILITGIGMPNTILHLTKLLENEKFDLIINVGIAGTFNSLFKIGDVVNVTKDCFADIGYENDENFIPFIKTDLINENEYPFYDGWLVNYFKNNQLHYKEAKGITVNKVHGNKKSIEQMQQIYDPDVESMEGAAVAFCCLKYQINFIQLRAISNRVEKRNKENWNIPLAIKNLNIEIERVLKII